MTDNVYKILRKIFFWFFFLAFIISTPVVVFYSLGYKFNFQAKRFEKTGIISIKSLPDGAEVYLNQKRLNKTTPCNLRELRPAKYKIRLEKEGFYPYEKEIEVKSGYVFPLDVVLLPKIKDVEKIKQDLDIIKFFVVEHIFGKRIVAFSKDSIYILNEDLEEIAKVSPLNMDEESINSIKGIKEIKNNFIFFSPTDIWGFDYGASLAKKENCLEHLYKSDEPIKEIFFGLKDRYIIIHKDSEVLAIDMKHKDVIFKIYQLNSKDAQVYYDSSSDVLFVSDKVYPSESFSLFKIEMAKKIYESKKD
jgi:hypothetical protein